jgi:DNA-binding transcriptional ArsR family regulator
VNVPRKKPAPKLIDPQLLRAEAHPIRAHILSILSEGPNSPARMQRRMENVSLNLVSYHIEQLVKFGCIELVRKEKKSNGSVEHIYRTVKRQFINTEQWKAVDPNLRQPITATILRMISDETSRSLSEGKFDQRLDNHLSRSPVELDQAGWREVTRILGIALEGVLEAHAKSAERSRLTGEERVVARVVLMQYLLGREDPRERCDDEAERPTTTDND